MPSNASSLRVTAQIAQIQSNSVQIMEWNTMNVVFCYPYNLLILETSTVTTPLMLIRKSLRLLPSSGLTAQKFFNLYEQRFDHVLLTYSFTGRLRPSIIENSNNDYRPPFIETVATKIKAALAARLDSDQSHGKFKCKIKLTVFANDTNHG